MDKKLKSIAWVGKNISQKFETMCQQVDNIVSQDTVKYVENQVQTMGGSMKRFYSDVILDLLPPLADPVKHEAQEVVVKRNDATGASIKSVIEIDGNSANTVIKQSPEPSPVNEMKNQLGHSVSGFCHENQPTTPASVDPVDGTQSDLVLGKIDDVLTHEICDVDVEENAIKEKSSTSELLELMSLCEKNSSEALSCCETIDSSNKNTCGVGSEISHANSVNVVKFQPTQSANTVCDNFADDSKSVSDASNTLAASEITLPAASCEEKMSETGFMSSSYSRLMESNYLHENSFDYLTTETALCTDEVYMVGVYDSCKAITTSISAPIVPHEDKEVEAELKNSSSVLSLKSREEAVSITDYMKPLTELSQKTNAELHGSARFEAVATSSDNGPSNYYIDDLDYSGMETIELCEKAKLEDSCIMVDDSALHAVSYRTRKLRSFKKRIQDAFASKRRLAKEYEQLAIWFGDDYMGVSQGPSQILLPSTTSAIADSDNSSRHRPCDSEWELL